MAIFPVKSETVVLPFSREYLLQQLNTHVNPVDGGEEEDDGKYRFNGTYSNDCFRISPSIKKPNMYIPLASAGINTTQHGQVILLRYTMFPGARRMLILWSSITFLLTLFFALLHSEYMYATICFSMGLVNYILAYENFRIQVRSMRRLMDDTIFKG